MSKRDRRYEGFTIEMPEIPILFFNNVEVHSKPLGQLCQLGEKSMLPGPLSISRREWKIAIDAEHSERALPFIRELILECRGDSEFLRTLSTPISDVIDDPQMIEQLHALNIFFVWQFMKHSVDELHEMGTGNKQALQEVADWADTNGRVSEKDNRINFWFYRHMLPPSLERATII